MKTMDIKGIIITTVENNKEDIKKYATGFVAGVTTMVVGSKVVNKIKERKAAKEEKKQEETKKDFVDIMVEETFGNK